ncbi:DUF885 family protein (plasmid) [Novosphingobium resinovorum]|uniref:DUF885 family protein n=1 Tax=Novosphingobium TaxID=165696 RepID=UPI001B3C98FF|nr:MULTISPECIES: DUF885 family protein [Novosphingobium]MBF7015278.1 DUF885 family protein [Novosphingobium sp. HR1a]WJM29954.1 DUF885 family protein [Novosphingobium resinovorum]
MKRASEASGRTASVAVRIVTALGDIVVDLNRSAAPATVAAFLAAVDAGRYDRGSFGRTVNPGNDGGSPAITVVQGYAQTFDASTEALAHEATTQTGLRHADGTISLARIDGGSASPLTFFFCIGDNPALDAGGGRTEDGLGFAAFGQVTEGMDVVAQIHAQPSQGEAPTRYLEGQVIDPPVPIHRVLREPVEAPARLAELCADYWSFQVREYPLDTSPAGEASAADRIDGATENDHARRATGYAALHKRAQAIDASALGTECLATLELLQDQIALHLEAYELGGRYVPVLFPFAFFDMPDMLIQQVPLSSSSHRRNLLARLEATPGFLHDNLAMLEASFARGYRLPRPLLPRILATLDGHLSAEGLIRRLERRLQQETREAAESASLQAVAADKVLPALAHVRARFAALSVDETNDDVAVAHQPNGREWYRHLVRMQTSLRIEPETVHDLGLAEVARINAEIEAVLAEMGRRGARAEIAAELDGRQARDAQDLLLRTRALAKQIDGLIPQIIGRTPRIPYGVEQMNVAESHGLPPGLALPAPATGERPATYLLNALPEKCPLHLLVPLTLHEAWPGHLMQFAIANEMENLPAFRRYGWTQYNGYVEGWALYCERLGYDLNLYADPADRFGLLGFEMWRATRLVVDTGLHWFGWTREQAIGYMEQYCFLPRSTIESEVDRYIGMPAQALSYKMGERVIARLRARAEAECGENFSLRGFHDALLETGPVSLDLLERHINRWIDGNKP